MPNEDRTMSITVGSLDKVIDYLEDRIDSLEQELDDMREECGILDHAYARPSLRVKDGGGGSWPSSGSCGELFPREGEVTFPEWFASTRDLLDLLRIGLSGLPVDFRLPEPALGPQEVRARRGHLGGLHGEG